MSTLQGQTENLPHAQSYFIANNISNMLLSISNMTLNALSH